MVYGAHCERTIKAEDLPAGMLGTALFIGPMGPLEIGIILLLIVVLFGADKIPKLARSAGEAKKEFEKAKIEAEKEIKDYEEELDESESAESASASGEAGVTKETEAQTESS